MSPLLREFLQAWIDWVDAGAVEDEPFNRCFGLCSNALFWSGGQTHADLKDALVEDGLDPTYPFGGLAVYMDEGTENRQHLNEARIAWVRSKVAQTVGA